MTAHTESGKAAVPRWFSRGVAGIGISSFLADLGHEIPTALLPSLLTVTWPGSPTGAYAIVGAAAMLGAAMQAPLTGLALMLELTSGGFGIMIPMVAATVTATMVARKVDGYSIYTARLRAR